MVSGLAEVPLASLAWSLTDDILSLGFNRSFKSRLSMTISGSFLPIELSAKNSARLFGFLSPLILSGLFSVEILEIVFDSPDGLRLSMSRYLSSWILQTLCLEL